MRWRTSRRVRDGARGRVAAGCVGGQARCAGGESGLRGRVSERSAAAATAGIHGVCSGAGRAPGARHVGGARLAAVRAAGDAELTARGVAERGACLRRAADSVAWRDTEVRSNHLVLTPRNVSKVMTRIRL